MSREFRITDHDLLTDAHFPVKAMFNMVQDYRFKKVVWGISNNRGFGENYGACNFWDDLDDYDKENTAFFEGAEFGLHNGEEVVIGFKELLYYLEIACARYCEDYPEDAEIINKYLTDYKIRNNLNHAFM